VTRPPDAEFALAVAVGALIGAAVTLVSLLWRVLWCGG